MRGILVAVILTTAATSFADDNKRFARENRVLFAFNFALGGVSQAAFNGYAGDVNKSVENQGLTVKGYEDPSIAIGAELALRYYAPYFIAAHVGAGALLAKGDYNVESGSGAASSKIEYWNLSMEVPILLGGHYPVHDRIHLHLLLGPSILAIPGSYWDSTSGGLPDFEGGTGVGFQTRLGVEFYALEALSFGIELVYRNQTVDVEEKKGGKVSVNGKIVDGFELDFSGVGMQVGFRLAM